MSWSSYYGFARSWLTYRGQFWRRARMREFYGQFVPEGGLCFDLGAHVGNRVSCWRELGASVVAVEPQPLFASYLRRFVADSEVEVLECAVGSTPGRATFYTSRKTPTLSTLSRDWTERVSRDERFARADWDAEAEIDVITLDQLVERYGFPSFCKIDVEGAELEVLEGSSHPLPALSFEFIPAACEDAVAVLDRLAELGSYRFNWSFSETMRWERAGFVDASAAREFLQTLPRMSASGDLYACLAR